MSRLDPLYMIFGYVEIKAENGFPERFVNTCTAEGIPLWDMKKIGNTICAKTTVRGFRAIRSPAKKSSMRVRMIKKHGLPFSLSRFSRRTGLIIGTALAALTLAFLSGHIWIIDADISDPVLAEKVIAAYEDAGLYVGASKRMNLSGIRTDVLERLEGISWTTANISGCTATLKVREAQAPEEAVNTTENSNIVALKDGQVEIIEPYRGGAAVTAGDTVTKGSLLVSGVTVGRLENSIFSPAQGYVAASTEIKVSTETSAQTERLIPKSKKVYCLYLLGREIPLGRGKAAESVYTHKSWLYLGGKKMPFGLYYRVFTDFEAGKITVSKAENLLTAINDYSLESYNRTLHAQVKSKNISFEQNENSVTASGVYSCYENIGKEIFLSVENSELTEAPRDATP